jgi:Ca-activated chloride channel family protein
MTDELKPLKEIFDAEAEIKASDSARKKALLAAMQAFESHHKTESITANKQEQVKEKEKKHQGNFSSPRQKDNDSSNAGFFTLLYWKELMKLSYVIPTVAAGALAVSVLVFNPNVLTSNSPDELSASYEMEEKSAQVSAQVNEVKNITRADSVKDADDNTVSLETRQRKEETAKPQMPASPAPMEQDVRVDSPVALSEVVAVQNIGHKFSKQQGLANTSIPPSSIVAIYAPARISLGREIAPAKSLPLQGRDKFQSIKTNPLKLTNKEPVSTFSIDVDTASYSFMRAAINRNTLPQKDAVRIEELINYFPYDYPQPSNAEQPFQVSTTVMPTPWNTQTKLLHIGIRGYQLPKQEQPKSNLVFLLDTSGSMNQANKLPLLKNSFKLLLSTLQPTDTVSIVAYAGSAGTVLPPTKVTEKATIIQALERLNAGGSTAGGEGIRLAYQLAEANYDKKAVNRVILATDGDFNVGINNKEELKSFIERKRQSGVFLSVLGFGMGNYNDALMQTLAQNGNGNAAYIDSLSEARKVLGEEASSTLFTIAKDVKIQMEFNPEVISQYRLIGYETRQLKNEDFNNDNVDAGDIGAGHTVTAIYEITPIGAETNTVDPLRYGAKKAEAPAPSVKPTEYGFLKLRYKLPNETKSQLIATPIHIADTAKSIDDVSSETRFATAVAAFGQLLRGGTYTHTYRYDDILALAQSAKGEDVFGYRAEFMTLVRLAKTAEGLDLR